MRAGMRRIQMRRIEMPRASGFKKEINQ